MKGLLLKEFYMAKKYCKSYLLVVVALGLTAFTGDGDIFGFLFPCLLAGMIPTTLLAYDERSKWDEYCGTLPYTRTQIVSAKYLIGLFFSLGVIALLSIAQIVGMFIKNDFDWGAFLMTVLLMFLVACIIAPISLPLMFKFGVEKGRVAYYVIIGAISAGSAAMWAFFKDKGMVDISFNGNMLIVCAVAVVVYLFSWYLSVVFYKKREF